MTARKSVQRRCWHCVEAMFRLNTLDLERAAQPEASSATWLDGRPLWIVRTWSSARRFPDMKFTSFLRKRPIRPRPVAHEQTRGSTIWPSGPSRSEAEAQLRLPKRQSGLCASARVSQPKNRRSTVRFGSPSSSWPRSDAVACGLEQLVRKAVAAGCDARALPEAPWPAQVRVAEPGVSSMRCSPRPCKRARPARPERRWEHRHVTWSLCN